MIETPHSMRAVVNTRRDICLNRCPLGAERCAAWRGNGEFMADPGAQCEAGVWRAFRRDPRTLATNSPTMRRIPVPEGAGTMLKRMLGWFGIRATGNCLCNRRALLMDVNGVEWCAANVDTIVVWMEEEAGRRGMWFCRAAARWLVRGAIARARWAASR